MKDVHLTNADPPPQDRWPARSDSAILSRSSFFAFLSQSIRLISNAVLFVLIARYFGPEGFGQFTIAHTLATILILVADFGFDLLLTTLIAREPRQASFLVPRMFGFKLVLSTIALAGMLVIPRIMSMSDGARFMTQLFGLYVFFSALVNFLFALFKGHEELEHETRISLAMNVFLLVSLFAMVLLGASLHLVGIAFVASRVLGFFVAVRKSRRYGVRIHPIWDRRWLASVQRNVTVFGVFFLFGNLFFQIDTVLLSIFKGDLEVGIYQSVFRLVAVALVIPDIVISASLPTLSRLFEQDTTRWDTVGLFAAKILFFMGIFLGLVMVVYADVLIRTVYGSSDFDDAITIMRVFGAIITVRYAVEIPALMLTTSNRQHVRMNLVILATVLNVGCNLYAIPKFGPLGAAFVSLLTNVSVGIGYVLTNRDRFSIPWLSLEYLIPFASVLALGTLFVGLGVRYPWYLTLPAILAIVPIVYWWGFAPQERSLMLKTLRRFRA